MGLTICLLGSFFTLLAAELLTYDLVCCAFSHSATQKKIAPISKIVKEDSGNRVFASLETAPLKAILDEGSGFAAWLDKKIAPTYNLKGRNNVTLLENFVHNVKLGIFNF